MNAAFSKSGPEGLYENFVSAAFPLSTIHHPQLYLHWESNDLNPDVCNIDNKTEGCLCLRKTGIYLFFNIYISSYSYNSCYFKVGSMFTFKEKSGSPIGYICKAL